MRAHRLVGLETDNLLGFLALLGLLRALERSRPSWVPRAHFNSSPLSTQLLVQHDAVEEEIAGAASEGCLAYADAFTFGGHSDLTFGSEVARTLLLDSLSSEARSAVMSAVCSDGAVREKQDRVVPTPLCAMFGQGHQSFLNRLGSVSAGKPPKAAQTRGQALNLNDPLYIQRALFAHWGRHDPTESFRWDFREDRRYALRYLNPSHDSPTTEHGANRLAVLGLLSFQCAPTYRGLRRDLAMRGASRGRDRRVRITWPIWHKPASLESIHAMLDDPELVKDDPSLRALERYSVDQLRRAYRLPVGKFVNFSRAEAIVLQD